MRKIVKRYSKNLIILRISSIVLILASLIFGIYVLNKSNLEVEKVSSENKNLKSDYIELKGSTLKIQDFVKNNTFSTENSDTIISFIPLKALIIPIVKSTPLNKKGYKNYDLYDFSLYLKLPESRKKEIKKVNYYFTHKYAFKLNSTNPEDNFRVKFEGWGCFTDIKISLFLVNSDSLIIHFNMCEELNW